MSIPVDFITPIYVKIGKEQIWGHVIQLCDGSLYLISEGGEEIQPMDRSYAGMILKESIHTAMAAYNKYRREYKIFKHAFKKTGLSADRHNMESCKVAAEVALVKLGKMRKAWIKFKRRTTKKKKTTDPEEAARLKEAAMVAKKISIRPDYNGFMKQYNAKCGAGCPLDAEELVRLGKRFHCLPDYEEGH
jgi:hypothetical protein